MWLELTDRGHNATIYIMNYSVSFIITISSTSTNHADGHEK